MKKQVQILNHLQACSKRLIVPLIFIFIAFNIESQESHSTKPAQIKVIARNYIDSVAIRWAPDRATAWKLLNNYGYILERLTVYKNGEFIQDKPEIKKLSLIPIKPFTKEQFEKVGDTSSSVLVIYQALYGETFQLNASESEVGPVGMINKAKELDNRFSFALFSADNSPKAAKMHGLWFTDKEIKPGEKYVYRVYSAVPDSVMKIDSGFTYVDIADTFRLPKPWDLKVDFRNRAAVISWDREFFENIFIDYKVERSDDGGKSFHSITDIPIINPYSEPDKKPLRYLIIDTFPQNNFTYQYRVKGITLFGETSPPSDIIEGRGYETGEILNPDIIKIDVLDNKSFIKWRMTGPDSVYVKGFDILRAAKNDGPYKRLNSSLLTPDTRIFVDTFPMPVNYYRINALDAKNKIYPSFTEMVQLIDSTPPAAPVNIGGYIDSAGLVHIHWDNNNEPDIASYRVFKANNPNAEFIKVNSDAILFNKYTDTTILKTLSPYLYYKVTAIDQRYNQSEYSEILKLKRPDVVPPAAPVINSYEVTDTGVLISWVVSPSEDVIKHKLYRQKLEETKAILIVELDSSMQISAYTDTTVKEGNSYKYLLKAFDDSGLESETSVIATKIPIKKNKPGVEDFSAKVNRVEGCIELNWTFRGTQAENFLIYRSDSIKALSRFRAVVPAENRYLDKSVKKEMTYGYCVQVVFSDGSKSKMSEVVKIRY